MRPNLVQAITHVRSFFKLNLDQAAFSGELGWQQLQLALLRRSLHAILPLTVLLGVFYYSIGAPTLSTFCGVGIMVAMLVALERWPHLRRGVAWAMGASALGLIGASLAAGKPVSLAVLAILPGLAFFLDGLALGGVLFAGVSLLFGALLVAKQGDVIAIEAIVPAAGTCFFMTAASMGWYLGLRRARRLQQEAQVALKVEAEQRARLVSAIFEDVVAGQAQLQQALSAPAGPDWEAARRLLDIEAARTEGLHELRSGFIDPKLSAPQGTDFSVAVLRTLMFVVLGMSFFSYYYLVLLAHGPFWTGPLLFVFGVVGLLALRRKVQAPRWLAWMMVGMGVLVVGTDQARDWGLRLTSTLCISCVIMLNAVLLVGWRTALALLAAGIVLALSAAFALPAGATPGQELSGLLFAYGLVALIGVQAVVWQMAVLKQLDDERTRLAVGLAQRRRLMGTLFHDISNPLFALRMVADLAKLGLAGPKELERSQRLLARLRELLQESRAWMQEDGSALAAATQRVSVDSLLAGINDLFVERLQDKRMVLVQDVEPGLAVLAQTSALRDSVISNLLSNAIKFSPPGSRVELRALRLGDRTCIELCDRGPGLSLDLRQRLQSGMDLPSLAGTAGEEGHGLGLGLAMEHVRRMGGQLDFLERAGGGLVARVCLTAP